jgi:malonyl-CoA O-methyltransferase
MPNVAGKQLLDVGCGTGRWLQWSAENGARAAGVDLSLPMLHRAARKPSLAGRVVCGHGSRAPFRDGCAEVVLSTLALGHMQPVATAMAEFARLAAPGAAVIVTDFHPDALRRGWKRTFRSGGETVEMDSDPYYLSELCNPDLILEELLEAGFDEPERPLFEAAGKGATYEQVCGQTAIFVAKFRRVE